LAEEIIYSQNGVGLGLSRLGLGLEFTQILVALSLKKLSHADIEPRASGPPLSIKKRRGVVY
jgi:hypothetical protein